MIYSFIFSLKCHHKTFKTIRNLLKSTNYYFLNDIEFQQMINTSKTLELKEYFKIIANDKPLERQIEY